MNKENNSKVFFTPPVLAVFFMIFSGFFATTMHCLIRFATEDHHPFEVAFFRTIFVLIIFLPLVARNGISSLKSNNIKYLDEPYTRFKDKEEQQETFFIKDPHGNILELKTLQN